MTKNEFENLRKFASAMLGDDDVSDHDRFRKNLSKHITSKVYAEVVIELQGDDRDKEKVDKLYQEKLCKLSTQDLDLILKTHEEGLFNRRSDTIDVVVDELARRALLEDE